MTSNYKTACSFRIGCIHLHFAFIDDFPQVFDDEGSFGDKVHRFQPPSHLTFLEGLRLDVFLFMELSVTAVAIACGGDVTNGIALSNNIETFDFDDPVQAVFVTAVYACAASVR